MKPFHWSTLSLALMLGACAYPIEDTAMQTAACPAGVAEATQGVDWATAEKYTLTIEDGGHVSPMYAHLKVGKPYVFKIVNDDLKAHRFDNAEFYHEQAVASLSANGKTVENPCFWAINVMAGKEVEFKLVAKTEGRYELADYPNLYLPLTTGVTTFVATVE